MKGQTNRGLIHGQDVPGIDGDAGVCADDQVIPDVQAAFAEVVAERLGSDDGRVHVPDESVDDFARIFLHVPFDPQVHQRLAQFFPEHNRKITSHSRRLQSYDVGRVAVMSANP